MDMKAKLKEWKEMKRKREDDKAKKDKPMTKKIIKTKIQPSLIIPRVANLTKYGMKSKENTTNLTKQPNLNTMKRINKPIPQKATAPQRNSEESKKKFISTKKKQVISVPVNMLSSQSDENSIDSIHTTSPEIKLAEIPELKRSASSTSLGERTIGGPLRIRNKNHSTDEFLESLDQFGSPSRLNRRFSSGTSSSITKSKEDRRASHDGTPSKRRSSISSGPLRVLANQSNQDSDDDLDDTFPSIPDENEIPSTLASLRVRTSISRLSTSRSRVSIESTDVRRRKQSKLTREDFKNTDKKLGFGKFGYVYLAKQKTVAEKEIALKVLTKSNMDEIGIRSLKMEVEIQSRLKHTNILRLYRYFHEELLAYLVLEYAPNGSLEKLLHEQYDGHFNEVKAAHFSYQIIQALKYLHARHVIHRDIKPENLLLGIDHTIKVADFGLAIHAPPPNSKRKHFCGTPEYMSPEIVIEREYSCEVDIWSFGIVVYEMLLGKTPFRGDDVFQNIQSWYEKKQLNMDLAVPGLDDAIQLSTNAKEFIQGLVAPADSRWTLDEALNHPWLGSFI